MNKAMNITLKLEEAAMTIVAIYFLYQHHIGLSFWIWLLLFFSPDVSMLGYLINTKIGAFTYNLFHHKGIALIIAAAGYCTHTEIWLAIGLLLFAHSSFDRMMGYGLKYTDAFKHTHLGWLPEKSKR